LIKAMLEIPDGAGAAMKFGVLTFSYSEFAHFDRMLQDTGHYTVNLGDNAQSIATRHLYRSLGVDDADIVEVDRDTLRHYGGPECVLLMNAVFTETSFPIPDLITPIFVGFSSHDHVIAANRDYLKRHEPIGCRDIRTAELLRSHGVDAYVTGCVTLLLPRRTEIPASEKLLIVFGHYAGTLPPSIMGHIPPELAETAEFVFHRMVVDRYPLPAEQQRMAERYENFLMSQFRQRATKVLTPLHHVAAPCLAMGIPVTLCRHDMDSRFDFLAKRIPIYTPDRFGEIDWNSPPPDFADVRLAFTGAVSAAMARRRSAP
jgi:hypothetical protein